MVISRPMPRANIWNDPHAADIVFSADWEIDLIGLDVAQKITLAHRLILICLPAMHPR